MPVSKLVRFAWPTEDHAFDAIDLTPSVRGTMRALRERLEREGFTHAVVYGDREHSANLLALTGFDPRFEEAILVVRTGGHHPLLLVGNECRAYLPVSPLYGTGELRYEVWQPLSLQDQPRGQSRSLVAILDGEGVDGTARVAVVGWKTHEESWQSDVPAYLMDALRHLAGGGNVEDQTGWMVDAAGGIRSTCDAALIAYFEQNHVKASGAMRRVLFGLRAGVTDRELLAESVRYDGTPLSCHMTLKAGPKRISLASPNGTVIERGHKWSANIGYWGTNVCRAGFAVEGPEELPGEARGYVEEFVGPYFLALVEWLRGLRVGAEGSALYAQVMGRLPSERYGVTLNPGHLIHYDEWPSSPFWEGSGVRLRSGMVVQSDVIPTHPHWYSTRMEDGYAIADGELRRELREGYPKMWARVEQRRRVIAGLFGGELNEDVLPLGETCGVLAPYGFAPEVVMGVG